MVNIYIPGKPIWIWVGVRRRLKLFHHPFLRARAGGEFKRGAVGSARDGQVISPKVRNEGRADVSMTGAGRF